MYSNKRPGQGVEVSTIGVEDEEGPGLSLEHVVSELEPMVTAVSEGRSSRRVSSIAMVDPSDIRTQVELRQPVLPDVDVVIMVGVTGDLAVQWLESLMERPVVLMVKDDILDQGLRAAADTLGIAVVAVDTRARWDVVLSRIRRMLDGEVGRGAGPTSQDVAAHASVGNLSDLANLLADGMRGMVTIENRTNRVLAYSPSESTADELRTRAILGRAAPPEVMEMFSRLGVVTTLASTTEVVTLPADPSIGMRRRLVTGIHGPEGEPLGSLWVQQGERDFSEDAETLLRGGAVSAAALILQARSSPSTAEEAMVRRLFGDDGGVDGRTAASQLQIAQGGRYSVIGFANGVDGNDAPRAVVEFLGQRLQLHVRAYASDGLVCLLGQRAYVLVPGAAETASVIPWVEQLLRRFDGDERIDTRGVRVAVAAPVDGLDAVAAARHEVDRVLSSPAAHRKRVTSLKQSRTTVLLAEALELLSTHPELEDPRLGWVSGYDEKHGTSLVVSMDAYLRAGMNVREAAAAMNVHPNTLRYRVDRAQQLSGLDFNDPDDRLLTALQLALRR